MLRPIVCVFAFFAVACFASEIVDYKDPSKKEIENAKETISKTVIKASSLEKDSEILSQIEKQKESLRGLDVVNVEPTGFDLGSYIKNKNQADMLFSAENGKISAANTRMTGTKRPYALVSFSMSDIAISNLIKEASKISGVVVLRGFVDGDFEKTIEKIKNLAGDNITGVTIDPTMFTRFNVDVVPTFIMPLEDFPVCLKEGCQPPEHVKARGMASFSYFFEMIQRVSLSKPSKILATDYLAKYEVY